ncbi:MAG: amidase, partial [Methylobacterium sp.]|nr:amidase [Methylobacterium sp.]
MPHHHLKASAETCHWGFFDAALPPVLTVASADTVTIDTVTGPP